MSRPVIDYSLLAEAKAFYLARGFAYVEVPWIVSIEADDVTRPANRDPVWVGEDRLVASGEQSFVQMMLAGLSMNTSLYQTITPCFRRDPVDTLHQPNFMKLELLGPPDRLNHIKDCALWFFLRYTDAETVETEEGYDIVGPTGIELGSYGVREYDKFKWAYGTGCAEPRLSINGCERR